MTTTDFKDCCLCCRRCVCKELRTTLDPDCDGFASFGHRMWIDLHNAYCPGDGVKVLDEDVFLFGHNPLGAWKAAQAKQLRLEAEEAEGEAESAE